MPSSRRLDEEESQAGLKPVTKALITLPSQKSRTEIRLKEGGLRYLFS